MALTTDSLRTLLGAAVGLEAGAYIDALKARLLLPADNEPLSARAIAIVALTLICGEPPAAAPSAALRLAGYRLSGITRRQDTAGSAALAWNNLPEAGSTLGDTLVGLIEDVAAGTWAATLPIVQARRVRSPTVDVVLIEAYQRAEGVPMLNGISFSPPNPLPVPPPA